MRVALVRAATTAGRQIADALVASLRFNGRSAIEMGETGFRDFTHPEGQPGDIPARVAEFKPHVILFIDDTSEIIEPLETALAQRGVHPYYLSSSPWEGEKLFKFLAGERRKRFFSVYVQTTTPRAARFALRFNEAFGAGVTAANAPLQPYDSMYLIAYGAIASREDAVTGASIAKGLARLVPPGKPVDVGAGSIFEAVQALRAGHQIDLSGASGKLDFDLATGETPQDFVLQCVGDRDVVESGIVYDAAQKKLIGTFGCQ
jgi:branched-chain amino acid transport system substrate-binding protein